MLKSHGSGDVLAESFPMRSVAMPAESALSCWIRRGLSVSITARALGGTSCQGERSFLPDRVERSQARAATPAMMATVIRIAFFCTGCKLGKLRGGYAEGMRSRRFVITALRSGRVFIGVSFWVIKQKSPAFLRGLYLIKKGNDLLSRVLP